MNSDDISTKVEFLVSTSATQITEKVNKWMEDNPEKDVFSIIPFMSYTTIKDKGAMMIGCMIQYYDYKGETPFADIPWTEDSSASDF